MDGFETSAEGVSYEIAVRRMVSGLQAAFPEIDSLALEAAMMFERTHAVLADMRVAYWSRFGLTPLRFGLLRLLYLAAGQRLTMSEIATGLSASMNSITQLIDGVVRDGLVERADSPDDKRVVFAVLTPQGRSLFAAAFASNAYRVSDAWSALSEPEKQTLIDLLARLRSHLLSDPE